MTSTPLGFPVEPEVLVISGNNTFESTATMSMDAIGHTNVLKISSDLPKASAEALDYFDESLKIAPENTLTIGNRAHSLRILKNYEEALACINELIKIEPDDVWNITEKIKIYWDWEKYDEAIEIAEHALRQFPNDEEQILNLLITICKKVGNTSKQKEYEEKLQNLRDSQ